MILYYTDILTQIMDSQRNNVDYGVDKQEELVRTSTKKLLHVVYV